MGMFTVLIGAQWGDEGKGKVIDVLTERADWVVRYQGGNNAGHTVEIDGVRHVLHLLPSGVLRPGVRCVIGNGVVVDPLALCAEIEDLRQAGVELRDRLFLSDRAHLVLPYHRALDAGREAALAHGERIGTTQRGIGPAYVDKAMRTGLRACALTDPEFSRMVLNRIQAANRHLEQAGQPPLEAEPLVERLSEAARQLAPCVTDTARLLDEAWHRGESVLFEGAQGTMLDVDFGTYPFVTSSNATAGGACTGSGVPPYRISRVIGVLKAYTTRVGEGPFPTELTDATGEALRAAGQEYGATTGRPRRCGWWDAVVARYSARINGVQQWALTKLDVLNGFDPIRLCVAYELDGRRINDVPADARAFAACRPVYEEMPGWDGSLQDVRRLADLPSAARTYLARIEQLTRVPIGILSLGPGRENTIVLDPPGVQAG